MAARITPQGSGNQRNASTSASARASGTGGSNDLHLLRQHVDSQVGALRAHIEAVDVKMDGKIAGVTAALAQAEADRTVAINNLTSELRDVRTTLPTSNTIWKAAGATVLAIIAAAGLAWAIFDTGGGFVGAFSDDILETKQQQRDVSGKLDKLLDAQKAPTPQHTPTEGLKADGQSK